MKNVKFWPKVGLKGKFGWFFIIILVETWSLGTVEIIIDHQIDEKRQILTKRMVKSWILQSNMDQFWSIFSLESFTGTLPNSPSNPTFCQNVMFFINLMVNYEQNVPTLHVSINILLRNIIFWVNVWTKCYSQSFYTLTSSSYHRLTTMTYHPLTSST